MASDLTICTRPVPPFRRPPSPKSEISVVSWHADYFDHVLNKAFQRNHRHPRDWMELGTRLRARVVEGRHTLPDDFSFSSTATAIMPFGGGAARRRRA